MSEQKRAGRPAIPVNETTAKRIKELRERNRETQSSIANLLGYESDQTVARWEKAERGIPDTCVKKLAIHWKVPSAYLQGDTDISDPLKYEEELEKEEAAAIDEYLAFEESKRLKKENFFDQCGFGYKYSPAQYDFAPLVGEELDGPHCITSATDPALTAYFSDEELAEIIKWVHRIIELEIYHKTAEKRKAGTM